MAKNRGKKRLSKSQIEAKKAEQSKVAQPGAAEDTIEAIDPESVQENPAASRMGPPPKYKPEYAAVARALCKRGATNFELAQEFGVNTSTIWRWSCRHQEFWDAMHSEKEAFDTMVERALAQRAVGYSFHTEKVFQFQGNVVRAQTVEHVPGDVAAMKLWLTNRKRKEWSDIQKHEVGGPGDFTEMSDDELQEYIAAEAKALQIPQHQAKRSGTKH